MKYDLELFYALNKEYESKPLVPAPRKADMASVVNHGDAKALHMVKNFKLENKRILEVGCGRGGVAQSLQELTGSEIVAIDIHRYSEWDTWSNPKIRFEKLDLTADTPLDIGSFDFIYSHAVIEHVRHPYTMIEAIYSLLNPKAQAYLYFNLFRGPRASHCYREVFFPWPHLLFDDSVFQEFYTNLGRGPVRPSWVNQLSIADYMSAFTRIGFKIVKTWFSEKPMDEEFYKRFEDKLSRIPRYDLTKDFIHAVLEK